ncbi:hypothetical protein GBP19_04070 [Pediococcus acidilactici]|uniref:hypothetical protein n=1 Tax=Pediococcus acidilactici TaxID=1254 RepID=UPI0013309FA1|nr:hypothetical protein [Pediococcus acidilactici]KAF0500083.1 hypothetical protein GBP19_04070 [Pediococcus acidilactici]
MKVNSVAFLVESVKTFVPPILAWWLATRSSKNSAKESKKEMREQLRITKVNNEHVQNMAYKLQFCIKELEKREYILEKNLSATNILQKSVERYLKVKGTKTDELKICVSELMETLHELIYSINALQVIVRGASPRDERKYITRFDALKDAGEKVEKDLYVLSLLEDSRTKNLAKVEKINNDENIVEYLNQLQEMRDFIMELMFTVMKKMG